jgi:hypothetical protein
MTMGSVQHELLEWLDELTELKLEELRLDELEELRLDEELELELEDCPKSARG